MKGSTIYRRLCTAPDLGAAVRALTPEQTTSLAAHIATLPRGDIPAVVFAHLSGRLSAPQTGDTPPARPAHPSPRSKPAAKPCKANSRHPAQ